MEPATFFVIGNHEVKSREGITQGHPTVMGAYALGVNPLFHFIGQFIYVNEQISKELHFLTILQFLQIAFCKVHWDITTATRVFVWLLPQTIQVISDCETLALL